MLLWLITTLPARLRKLRSLLLIAQPPLLGEDGKVGHFIVGQHALYVRTEAINKKWRRFMEYTSIPDVTIPASRVGLGTWAMGGVQWGGTNDDESVRTIHAALDLGITLIDTAPAYGFGHSEKVVGRAIAERGGRDRIVVATKVGLEKKGDG